MVELRQPPHALERTCELADLVLAGVHDRLVEHPVGDAAAARSSRRIRRANTYASA